MSALSTQGNNFTDEQILAWIEEGKSGRHPKAADTQWGFNVAKLSRWVSTKTGKKVSEAALTVMMLRVTCHRGPVLKHERTFIGTKHDEGLGPKAIQESLISQTGSQMPKSCCNTSITVCGVDSEAEELHAFDHLL